jgi:branched-chain amino acid transport system ATP-binding protein
LDGEVISGQPPHAIAHKGIAYVPQGRGIFPKLTVHENLMVGTRAQKTGASGIPAELFAYFPVLQKRLDQLGGTLSGGEQQQLAIGRALCGKPKILLLDEPSDGIQPNIVQQIGELLVELVKQTEISILIIEQNLDLVLHVAHRCIVMDKGQIIHRGRPDDFQDERLVKKYLAI